MMSQSAVTQGEGRPVDIDLHKRVRELLAAGLGIRYRIARQPLNNHGAPH
jgi:hypothetical protein